MLLRRSAPLALVLAALACEPSVPTGTNPTTVDYAGFDPLGDPAHGIAPSIPLPNDLALQEQAISGQNASQQILLRDFRASGGFPNDQEVPVTIDFVRSTIDPATGAATRSAPAIDVTSINQTNLVILLAGNGTAAPVAYDQPVITDYAVNGDHGTLTLHKSAKAPTGTRRWDPGQYIVAVRGQKNGVKVTGSTDGLQPQPALYLLLQDADLTRTENQGIIPGNTRAEKAAAAALLESIRKNYLTPFLVIDKVFNHSEIATMGTFRIAPVQTHVETDPSAGALPLPSDFLSGPDGHILPQLADPRGPFGALGPGLGTLDGFSTTAMILSQVSGPILAATVNKGSAFIFELGAPAAPGTAPTVTRLAEIAEIAQGKAPKFVAEPSAITQTPPGGTVALSTAIGLQPAVPAQIPGGPFVALPPLKEGTTYVVLLTDGIKDINNAPLARSTLGKILLFDAPFSASTSGKSNLAGVPDGQAIALDQMRGAISLAAGALAAEPSGVTRAHLVMGYTFHTQTFKSTAVNLAALPYSTPLTTLSPLAPTKRYGTCLGAACPDGTVADVFAAYGVDTDLVPTGNIGSIVEATILTFNGLNDATGAFRDLTKVAPTPEPITALISLPKIPVPGSACVPGAAGPCTVPLVIFRHGFGGGRGDMLPVADTLNAMGIAVASIDANKHGDRSFCSADAQCNGGTCNHIAAQGGQGDAAGATPGKCSGDFKRHAVLCPGCPAGTITKGTPDSSANFLIGSNLFRTRDTLRQDIIDESQLIRVLAPNPAALSANAVITADTGFQINPSKIWYVGISLGSISGTVDVAANPRISKAAFSVGGGTLADIFTNSPSFAGRVNGLLASLGILPGTAGYLQFINVAKWILDPADPLNFADNLSTHTLASPLSGNQAPAARKILGQVSNCDLTVPNPFNAELDTLAGLGPVSQTQSTLQVFIYAGAGGGNYSAIGQTSCRVQTGATTFVNVPEAVPNGGAVPHGLIEAWGLTAAGFNPALAALTQTAQTDVANFLFSDTKPPPVRNAGP